MVILPRARALLAVFATALVLGGLLFVLTDPGIQTVGAAELVARRSDAVAFFTFDYVFIVVYAVMGPAVLWRFGRALRDGHAGVPALIAFAAVALVVGGALDAIENGLLLSASSSGSESVVRTAHLLALPKYVFGGAGLLLSVWAVVRAGRAVREER